MHAKLSFEQAFEWAESIVQKMTLSEKCDYLGGTDAFFTKSIDRLGISKVMFADATAGVVLRDRFFDVTFQNPLKKSVAFPAPIMLAATWNTELAEDYARAIGEECQANGIGVLLAPGFNLYRISQCGRNFEYFGEDPFLISRMVERYVEGVQSTGTIATLKHFVANNTDYFRRKSNSIVDERTLHEIYLPAFKAGIDAGAMAVMTSYNLVNGEWAGQSRDVIKDLLRDTLGFKWLVMSDWWSVYDAEKLAASGQDLEMPASDVTAQFEEKIVAEDIYEKDIDRMVKSILTTLKAMDLFERKPQPELVDKLPEHEQVALQTAREGTVLLKNRDQVLPLDGSDETVLLLGDFIQQEAVGKGSSFVKGFGKVSQFEAFEQMFDSKVHYDAAPTDEVIRSASKIILSIGTLDSESWDRPFELTLGEELYIKRVLGLNSHVIVLVNSGSGIKMTDWYGKAAAIVYCFYNGQAGNHALAEILTGKCNPSGKLPFTIERDFSDSPGGAYIPDGETLYVGENDAWEAARDVYDVEYSEGVFVGYRWYDYKNIEPLYPFGFGLSYTGFSYSGLEVATDFTPGEDLEVCFTITNTGDRAGSEIAQIYVRDLACSEDRPVKELKGFAKIDLEAGEKKEVAVKLKHGDFAFWSNKTRSWTVEPGEFEILIGASSNDIRLQQITRLSAAC